MYSSLFRIRFNDGGLDGGCRTGYMIRYLNGAYWDSLDTRELRSDVRFNFALDAYKQELLDYWGKHSVVSVAPENSNTGTLCRHQYTAITTQPLWQNLRSRIALVNKNVRLGNIDDAVREEFGIRLALLHVDPAIIYKICNENTRLQTLSSDPDKYYVQYDGSKIVECPLDEKNNEYRRKYGQLFGCTTIDESIPYHDTVLPDEIESVEQETGFKFYYLIHHAGRVYGLYINPHRPETWAGERRALNSGNYIQPYALKPILRLFAPELEHPKYVFLPLCNCMGRIRINSWYSKPWVICE